jgi:hypothetical protein
MVVRNIDTTAAGLQRLGLVLLRDQAHDITYPTANVTSGFNCPIVCGTMDLKCPIARTTLVSSNEEQKLRTRTRLFGEMIDSLETVRTCSSFDDPRV